MIDYSTYKKFYVNTGIFTLSGIDYSGYVEIVDGKPRVFNVPGKTCNTISYSVQELTPTNTYQSDLYTSKFFYDRLVSDTLTLPNSIDDIIIQPNDFLSEEVINKKLSLLKENNTYCYSRLFMPNNNLPYNMPVYAAFTSISSTNFTILSGVSNSIPFYQSVVPSIAEIRGFACVNNTSDQDKFVMFAYTDTNIITLSGSNNSLEIISQSNLYQDNLNENTQTFGRIGDICVQGQLLFVTDSVNNVVLKYDISTYVTNDNAFIPSRILVEVIGAKGKVTDSFKFNTPTLITSSSDRLFVFDSNNFTIKVYDLDFNFITRVNAINLRSETLLALEYNSVNNYLYSITKDVTGNIKLYILNGDYTVNDKQIFTEKLLPNENIKNIAFSYNDSNIFYICTNYNIYKKLINKPDKNIGRFVSSRLYTTSNTVNTAASNLWNYVDIAFKSSNFLWNLNSPQDSNLADEAVTDNNRGIYITSQLDNSDKIFFITGSKIFFFKESPSYKRVLKTENITNYGINNINLFNEEYVQASSLNKELYKLVVDIFLLKNNIRGRFAGSYDSQGILVLEDYNYNINFNNFNTTTTENFYIHENEKAITGVVNRVLSNIFNLQQKMIELTSVDNKGTYAPVFNTGSLQPSNVLIID
jgi:hypothetical protein